MRARLRAAALTAEELEAYLTTPETLSSRQALRLAAAFTRNSGDLIRHALTETRRNDAVLQWQMILPILVEAENHRSARTPFRPGRPRRLLTPRHGVNIRWEMTSDGWCLHFTGRDATGMMMDSVFDEIERM